MKIPSFCLLLCLLVVSFSADAATQRALLIGVSNYEAGLPPLAGSKNDVMLIRELLVHKFGFDRANIQVLIDEQATRQGIFAAVENLSKRSGPDDIVLIHFSGHGSQAPDTNGDEPDGFDETILPHDSRTPGIADITDDEINTLVSRFDSQSVVVILDSCHSGTGTRSGPTLVTQRWVAPDTRRELYEKVATRQVVTLPVSENHVFFAAAQEFESELDGPFGPDNMRLGLFTAAMVGVLANAPPAITPRQAIEGVNARVEALKASAAGMPIPEPNMEAPLEKQGLPMFVFRNSAPQAQPQQPQQPQQSPVQFTSGDRPDFGTSQAIFVIANGAPRPDIAGKIAASAGSEFVVAKSLAAADAVVDVAGQGTYDVYGPGGAVKIASGLTKGSSMGNQDDFTFLGAVLSNAPTLADLVSLTTPPTSMQMSLKAAGASVVRSSKVSTRTVKVSVNTAGHKLEFYRPDQPRTRANSLQLEAASNQDCYLTIASLNSAGEVYMLLPNAGQEMSGFLGEGLVRANSTVLIPDSLAPGNDAGFYFDYAPPGGIDRVIGICMTELMDARRLREQLIKLENGETVSQGLFTVEGRGLTGITPGPARQQQAMANPDRPAQSATAEPEPSPPKRPRWAASILTLEVGI
jgi:hypothetical protein